MQNKNLIKFAEEKVEQFKNDLLIAKPEENQSVQIKVKLDAKKNQYWDEIMDHIQIHIDQDNLDGAYMTMSKYHTQFQSLLEGFIQNKCSA